MADPTNVLRNFQVPFGEFTLIPTAPPLFPPVWNPGDDGWPLVDTREASKLNGAAVLKIKALFGPPPKRRKDGHSDVPAGYWWRLESDDVFVGTTFVVITRTGKIVLVMTHGMVPGGLVRNIVSYQIKLRLEAM